MREYLLPRQESEPHYETVVQTLNLTGEDADTIFDALSSETSREVFEHLYESPSTPSELAEELNTSSQNIHYHLGKLEAADLVESVDTVYSSRGVEIDVYAPTSEALVLVTGTESRMTQIKRLLTRFLGGVGILALASVAIQYWFTRRGALAGGRNPSGHRTGTPTPSATSGNTGGASLENLSDKVTETLTPTPTPEPTSVSTTFSGLPPGALFFIGGLLVLIVASWWMYRDMNR